MAWARLAEPKAKVVIPKFQPFQRVIEKKQIKKKKKRNFNHSKGLSEKKNKKKKQTKKKTKKKKRVKVQSTACHYAIKRQQTTRENKNVFLGLNRIIRFKLTTNFDRYAMLIVRNSLTNITKTCLYNFDPVKPHFYIVKLGFTGVYIILLISAQKHRLWVLVRTASPMRF